MKIAFILALILTGCGSSSNHDVPWAPPAPPAFFDPEVLPGDVLFNEIETWQTLPVPVVFGDELTLEQRTAIENAVATWEAAAGRDLIEIVGTAETKPDITIPSDGLNGIYMPTEYSDSGVSSANCKTHLDSTGITEADIFFSAKYFATTGDFETIALHEIGHLLGLSHGPEAYPNALMRASISGNQRTLTKADVAYIQQKYPK